jgi:CDGSH-type Zn-finger protein
MAAKITIKSHASIRVEGDFELLDMDGNKFDLTGRTAVSLCRCGQSKDKPFCDGTHRACNFQSDIKARKLPPLVPKT